MVPHPVLIFLALIAIVIVLSHILHMAGASVTQEVIVPTDTQHQPGDEFDPAEYDTGVAVNYQALDEKSYKIEERTITARSLLTGEGIRFIYSSLIPSFMSFTAVGLMIAAMIGAGVAEESGLVKTLIRKLVIISPPWALTYILAFVGILSSIAVASGIAQVWREIVGGKVRTLLVEKDYKYATDIADDGVRLVKFTGEGPQSLDDIVDEAIERVLASGGQVFFCAAGDLGVHQKIAAVLRG